MFRTLPQASSGYFLGCLDNTRSVHASDSGIEASTAVDPIPFSSYENSCHAPIRSTKARRFAAVIHAQPKPAV